jgi:uncharacterized protein with PIN domain
MIVADTSALVAIVSNEAERAKLLDAISQSDRVLISSPPVLETRMVVRGGKGEDSHHTDLTIEV